MRVLVIFESLHPPSFMMRGGTSIIYDTLRYLSKRKDMNVHVLTSIYPNASPDYKNWFKKQKKYNITFHYLDFNNKIPKRILASFYKIALFFKIYSLNKKYKFDIIHDYSSSPVLCLRAGIIGKLSKAKTIHTICTFNNGLSGTYNFVRFANLCDKIIVQTDKMKIRYINKGLNKTKAELIPLGVNYNKFNIKRDCKNKNPTFLFIGPFIPRKGIFTFIKAANKLIEYNNKVKFILSTHSYSGLGNEGNDTYLKKLVTCYRDNFEILTGEVNVPKLMSKVDFLIVPQDTTFGTLIIPLTLLEGMANGLPVIASDTEGISDVIKNNKNGFLFKQKDYYSLYNVMKKLINNKAFSKKIAKNGKLTAKRLIVGDMADKLYNLYKQLLR